MTKEELEKEAEKYFKSICVDYIEEFERTGKRHYFVGFDIENAYLAAAEPREKRIEELEKENAELKEKCETLEDMLDEGISYQKAKDYDGVVTSLLEQNRLFTKAKKIIKKLVNGVRVLNDTKVELIDCDEFLAEAEQFISEVEK